MSTELPYTSEPCCRLPPVQATYEAKGEYIALAGYDKVYVSGQPDAKTAILVIYDIFGFYPQTLQGADLLANAVGARLVMPDVFHGEPYPLDQFPATTDEQKKNFGQFFATKAALDNVLPGVLNLAKLLRDGGVTKLYTLGYCWGAKVAIVSGSKTLDYGDKTIPAFDAVAGAHPAMLSAKDGEGLLVPLGLFPSKDEPLDEYKKMVEELGKKPFAAKNAYRVYDTMHHGWAAARGDLNNEENKKQYEDVYGRIATFFKNAGED